MRGGVEPWHMATLSCSLSQTRARALCLQRARALSLSRACRASPAPRPSEREAGGRGARTPSSDASGARVSNTQKTLHGFFQNYAHRRQPAAIPSAQAAVPRRTSSRPPAGALIVSTSLPGRHGGTPSEAAASEREGGGARVRPCLFPRPYALSLLSPLPLPPKIGKTHDQLGRVRGRGRGGGFNRPGRGRGDQGGEEGSLEHGGGWA